MRVLIIKDGTIPVVVAEVVAWDHGADLDALAEELAGEDDVHQRVELFEIADGSRYVSVTWSDGMGFSVGGFTDGLTALEFIKDDLTGHEIEEYEAGKHWNVTYGDDPDDESYGHVFRLAPVFRIAGPS